MNKASASVEVRRQRLSDCGTQQQTELLRSNPFEEDTNRAILKSQRIVGVMDTLNVMSFWKTDLYTYSLQVVIHSKIIQNPENTDWSALTMENRTTNMKTTPKGPREVSAT